MKKNRTYPNCASVCAHSAEILSRRGNRLLLIEAISLSLLVIPIYYAFYTVCGVMSLTVSLVPMLIWEWLWGAMLFFMTLFVTLPLWMGVLEMAMHMEAGEETVLPDLFVSFTSFKRYGNALWRSWRFLWLPFLIGFAMWASYSLLNELFVNATLAMAVSALVMLIEGVLAAGLLLTRFGKTAAMQCEAEDEKTQDRSLWGRMISGIRFFASYFLRILLGLVSIGVLLLMDVIPEMMIAYFRYCKLMNDNDDPIGGINKDE